MPLVLQWVAAVMSTHVVPPQSPWPVGHWQMLFVQIFPPVHEAPQVPQWELSEVRSTQPAGHDEYPEAQVVPQMLPVQVGMACAAAVVHSAAEQHAGAVMPMQVLPPAQARRPVGHAPLQAASCAMQVPLQACGRLAVQPGTLSLAASGCAGKSGAWSAPRSGEAGESGVVSRGVAVSRAAGVSGVEGASIVGTGMSTAGACSTGGVTSMPMTKSMGTRVSEVLASSGF
jgi:hypothetical protein